MLDQNDLEMLSALLDQKLSEKLKAELQPLKDDIAELKFDVAELKSNVTVLQIDVADLKANVAELKSTVAVLQVDVADLKADVTELKSNVTVLQSDVSELQRRTTVISLTIENKISPSINVLVENYLPAVRQFRVQSEKYDDLQANVDNLNIVVKKHSQQLQKLS